MPKPCPSCAHLKVKPAYCDRCEGAGKVFNRPTMEEAFKAGYNCRWHKDTGSYSFDPLMSPGDPDGAYRAWLLYLDNS